MARKAWKRAPRAKFDAVLKAIPKNVEKAASDVQAINGREATRIIRGDVPFDEGALISSVDWSYGDPPAGIMKQSRAKKTQVPKKLRISIWAGGRKAPHAHLVHNGTAKRTAEDGGNRGVMPAIPFFWPNIRSLRRRQKSRITRAANKALKGSVK